MRKYISKLLRIVADGKAVEMLTYTKSNEIGQTIKLCDRLYRTDTFQMASFEKYTKNEPF